MKKNKRILVVCQHFWPEQFRITDICEYFVSQGYEVEVLCGIPNYPKGRFYSDYSYFRNRKQTHNDIKIHRAFEIPRGKSSNFLIFLNNISFPLGSLLHIPRLLTKKYDKIFIYELSPVLMAFTGIVIGKIKKIEITMWVIDLWPENLFSFVNIKNKLARNIATRVSHWHYKNVDKLVVMSKAMQHHLITVTGLPTNNVIELPMACEKLYEEEIVDEKIREKYKKNGLNILFTGTITPILSFETVIKAMEILRSKGITDIYWTIVGDGMSKEWLQDEVTKNNLKNNFTFIGLVQKEEIPKYTTNVADVLFSSMLHDSLLEVTIPAKVMSYLAAGKPILLSMNGAACELIEEIGCGYTSPAEDAASLAKNLELLYKSNTKDLKKMGNLAKDFHFKNYERNIVMNKLDNFMFE